MTGIPETIDSAETLSEAKLSEKIVSKTRSAETTLFDMRFRDKTPRNKLSETKFSEWLQEHTVAAMAREGRKGPG